MLKEREASVLTVLVEYIKENEYPPSFREVMARTGITTTSLIHYYYDNLEEKGYIVKTGNKSRAIKVLPKARSWYNEQSEQVSFI